MFGFIKNSLKKLYTQFTSRFSALFSKAQVDSATLEELERILLSADTGVATTRQIITQLKAASTQHEGMSGEQLKKKLEEILEHILTQHRAPTSLSSVVLLVGINGSGKTTFAGKLAHLMKEQHKKVLLVAADTFRAAATAQLTEIGNRLEIPVLVGSDGQDPASLVFAACEQYKKGTYDTLIIDTAGRLQTKEHLMRELEKVRKVIGKQLPDHTITTLLTIDSMLGQNSFEQARLFAQSTQVNGIVLTKMDGTAKGGIVFSIVDTLHIPVRYISYGEAFKECKEFNPQEFVKDLLHAP